MHKKKEGDFMQDTEYIELKLPDMPDIAGWGKNNLLNPAMDKIKHFKADYEKKHTEWKEKHKELKEQKIAEKAQIAAVKKNMADANRILKEQKAAEKAAEKEEKDKAKQLKKNSRNEVMYFEYDNPSSKEQDMAYSLQGIQDIMATAGLSLPVAPTVNPLQITDSQQVAAPVKQETTRDIFDSIYNTDNLSETQAADNNISKEIHDNHDDDIEHVSGTVESINIETVNIQENQSIQGFAVIPLAINIGTVVKAPVQSIKIL